VDAAVVAAHGPEHGVLDVWRHQQQHQHAEHGGRHHQEQLHHLEERTHGAGARVAKELGAGCQQINKLFSPKIYQLIQEGNANNEISMRGSPRNPAQMAKTKAQQYSTPSLIHKMQPKISEKRKRVLLLNSLFHFQFLNSKWLSRNFYC